MAFRAGKSYDWSIKEINYININKYKNMYRAFFSRVIRRPAGLSAHNFKNNILLTRFRLIKNENFYQNIIKE